VWHDKVHFMDAPSEGRVVIASLTSAAEHHHSRAQRALACGESCLTKLVVKLLPQLVT
jgi:hypothetical protein